MINFLARDKEYDRLWKIIEEKKYLSKDRFREILKIAKNEGRSVSEILFEDTDISAEKILPVLARFFKVPAVKLREKVISPEVLGLISKEVAEQHAVIVFKKIKEVIQVAAVNPGNNQTIDFIRQKTKLKPKVFITTPEDIKQALRRYKTEIGEDFARIIKAGIAEALATHETAEKIAQHVPIIRMVDNIIEKALTAKASDIHFEPYTDKVVIRFRIDGLLKKIVELPKAMLEPLVTRLKIMANLKIDEHRAPQDGRLKFKFNEQEVAVRVSVVPTLYGGKVVLRLLDMEEKQFTLRKLGLNNADFKTMKNEIRKTQGLILVTGPTGSGKTTTLYSLLRMLNREEVNICTIEDPIEYGIEGINQTQVNPSSGLTFLSGLRSLLRQDPNVIMVGEIRDLETANMAVNAAMTGHLVLSTLHTNNAFLGIQRLIEMGIEPYLGASVINIIIGQRLVRKVCPFCKSRKISGEKLLEKYGAQFEIEAVFNKLKKSGHLPADKFPSLKEVQFAHGKGCPKCSQTGYKGRIGIYEILKMDKELYETIIKSPLAESIKKTALQKGVLTMAEDGLLKVFLGRTTFEEVLRVTKE